MIELNLPWPPSVNHYKAIGRLCRTKSDKIYQSRRNSPETIEFYWRVKQITCHQAFKFCDSKEISVEVYLHPPNKRSFDIDNRCKVLLDALVIAEVIEDDKYISRLLVERRDIISEGLAKVKILELYDAHT